MTAINKRIVTLALSAVLATGAAGALTGCGGKDNGAAATATTSAPATNDPITNPTAPVPVAAGPQTPANTPEDAVRMFVEAEARGDFDASFALLSAVDQAEADTADGWRSDHKSIPVFRSVNVASSQAAGTDRVEVSATVGFEARLDPVAGLIPAQADAQWIVVSEGGSWRIRYAEAAFQPRYGDDAAAASAAVKSWATSRQNCALDAIGEYDGGLVGSIGLASSLCKTAGSITVGSALSLAGPEGTPVIAAYGPEAELWAKVVAVTAPVALRAVVAPVGDTWMVIGVLSPALNSGK